MPTMAEFLQTAAGETWFTKFFFADAYFKVELGNESNKYVIFTTHKGLYQINRLAVGLLAALAIF